MNQDRKKKSPSHGPEICWELCEDLSCSLDFKGFLSEISDVGLWNQLRVTRNAILMGFSYSVLVPVVLHRMTHFCRIRVRRSVDVCQDQFLLLLFFSFILFLVFSHYSKLMDHLFLHSFAGNALWGKVWNLYLYTPVFICVKMDFRIEKF